MPGKKGSKKHVSKNKEHVHFDSSPSLKNPKFEQCLKKVFELCSILKDLAKTNMIHLTHAPEPKRSMKGLRSSMETKQVTDTFMDLLAAKSPNTIAASKFLEIVLKSHMKEMTTLCKHRYSKHLAEQNIHISRDLLDALEKFCGFY